MNSFFSIFRHFKNAELVCFVFIIFTIVNILTNPYELLWGEVKWAHFPRIDLMAIVLSVWLFKITTLHKKLRHIGLITLGAGVLIFPSDYQGLLISLWFAIINLVFFKRDRNSFIKNISSLRLLVPFFVMLYLYPFIPLLYHSQGSSTIADFDALLLKADIFLFGGINPHYFLEKYHNPFVMEFLAFCYTFYGLLIALTLAGIYLIKSDRECEEFIFMLTLTLMIGYIGYLLVPAIGPIFHMQFEKPLNLIFMRDIKELLMDKTRIARDCFPSLHTAVTLILCHHIKKHGSKTAQWMLLPFAILIPVSCVLLRYHYVVDIIAGVILAFTVILVGEKIYLEPQKKDQC